MKITLFKGDGIGPEITAEVVRIINELHLPIEFEEYDIGQTAYEKYGELIPESAIESIKRNRVALKAPVTTPVGKGFRSVNVGLRLAFDLLPISGLLATSQESRPVMMILIWLFSGKTQKIFILAKRELLMKIRLKQSSALPEKPQNASSKELLIMQSSIIESVLPVSIRLIS